jgi:uncharacterized membrane protein
MIPAFLGIQLAVSYLFAAQVNPTFVNHQNRHRKFWQVTLLVVLTSGVISCAVVSQANTWWNNLTDTNNRQLAQIINQPSNPLVIQEIDSSPPRYNVFNLISLSYFLKPEVKFKFIPKNSATEIPQNFSNVFFMSPSHVLKAGIEKKYNTKVESVKPIQGSRIWKLVKN